MNKFFLKIARRVFPLLPRGRSAAICLATTLFGRKFEDTITLPDGCRFYINVISTVKEHLFFLNKYEDYETKLVKKIVKSGDTVFDIGANFGWYTIIASKLVGSTGKVYAFEMVPNIVKEFRRNMELNHLEKNITVENIALGEKTGMIKYFYSEDQEMGNFQSDILLKGSRTLKEGVATMLSLDDYVRQNMIPKVDFIKCDIDGAEVLFLKGARKTIETKKPTIVVEVNERAQKAQGHSCREIFEELGPFGYSFFSLRFNLRPIEPGEFGRNFKDNILCLPIEKLDLLPELAGHLE